jgi:two-component system, OmpR family, sensor histidine kinase TctE
MGDLPSPRTSIRRRLLIFLTGSLLVMIVGAAIVTYRVAVYASNDAYDRSLLDPALDIADHVSSDGARARIDLPQKALEALTYDQLDKVIFQVRTEGGEFVEGVPELPMPPPVSSGQHLFFDGMYRGDRIRLVALHAPAGFVIQIGETLNKRNRLISEILLAELVPTLLVAAAAIALALLGVAHGLLPLEHMRAELLGRSPRDLRPIPETAAPIEVTPAIDAFNGLLDQLRDASTMQQRFLANAAHQLRTPLAGLQMHLELLLRRELPPDIASELQRMHSATVRAGRLANQLLALAKAESVPDQDRAPEVVDLMAIADSAARDWPPGAIAQKIDLGFALASAPMLGDPVLLQELLDNIIDNALRYTPAGGTVTVSTGVRDGKPYLCVEDTGPGIPADERGKVVERFYRIAGTTGDGSGLGLAIVKEIVDRHLGRLEIDSHPANGGTCIRVIFPAAAPVRSPALAKV